MKNILLYVIALFFAELSLAQNKLTPGIDHPTDSSVDQLAFPASIENGDPLKTIQAIQDFNKRSESLTWRTEKIFQLDSIVRHNLDFTYEGFQRTAISAFEYTAADLVSATISFWVSPITGDTTGGVREDFQYNALQQLTQYEYSFWNTTNASWIIYGRQILYYNDKDLLSGYTNYYSNQNELVPASKTEITYNGVQLPILELAYDWDESLFTWKETYRYEYSYTAFKKLNSETLSYKIDSTSQWVWLSKTEYSYGQGLLLTKTLFDWNVNVWDRVSRSYFTYDDQHNLILQADKVWMDPPQMWLDDMEYRYEYDNTNRRISAADRRWFNDGHEWILGDSTAITYNADNDTALVVDYPWIIPTHPVDPKGFTSYTYDPEINFSSIRWPNSYWETLGSTFNKQVKVVYDSYRLSSNPDSSIYYYSLIVAATEIPEETWSVYPNPANEEIRILTSFSHSADAIEIYSMEGKLMKTLSAKIKNTVPVQDLAPGVYVFRIKKGNTFLSGQFIKQ